MTQLKIKEYLKKVCVNFVTSKSNTIQKTVQSNQEALDSESKSSAGDKHETGRAMLQLEMEKSGQQLKEVEQMKLVTEKIDSKTISKLGSLGAVMKTNTATYYLGISVGKVELENEYYFIVSPSSPIGRLLLGKSKNDKFLFQGKKIIIQEVF